MRVARSSAADAVVRDGYRLRGSEINRTETLVYAAFAFALTLLVISVGSVPRSQPELIEAMKQIPAFALAFAMIGVFWRAYAVWCNRFGLEDRVTVVLSFALMFTVMVFVYPLRAMTVAGVSFFSGGLIASDFAIRSIGDLAGLFAVYGAAYAALSLLILALYRHVGRRHAALGLSPDERARVSAEYLMWSSHTVCGLLVALAALLLPGAWVMAAPWLFFGMIPVGLVYQRRLRAADELASGGGPGTSDQ